MRNNAEMWIEIVSSVFALFINVLIVWAVYNNIVADPLNLPHFSYWQMFAIKWAIGSLLPQHFKTSSKNS